MNPVASLFGSIKALAGRADWPDHFDLSRKGLQASFVALLLSLPAFYLIALSAHFFGLRLYVCYDF